MRWLELTNYSLVRPIFRVPWRAAAAVAVMAVLAVGCERFQPATPSQSPKSRLRRVDRSEALLGAAVNQLRDLPSFVTTELRLPDVILDSTKSSDGQDVLAIATANPAVPDGPINVLSVPIVMVVSARSA
jgi:hypothetical protein